MSQSIRVAALFVKIKIHACMAESTEVCWCVNAVIPSELIALVPEELINKSCICNNCVALFLQDPEKFNLQ